MFIPEVIADVLRGKPELRSAYRSNVPKEDPHPRDKLQICSFCNEKGHKRLSCPLEMDILELCENENQYVHAQKIVAAFVKGTDPRERRNTCF